jgi:hypothetical protein
MSATTLTVLPASGRTNEFATLQAQLVDYNGNPLSSATIDFVPGVGIIVGTPPLTDATGATSCEVDLTNVFPISSSFTASFAGDGTNDPSSSPPAALTVEAAAPSPPTPPETPPSLPLPPEPEVMPEPVSEPVLGDQSFQPDSSAPGVPASTAPFEGGDTPDAFTTNPGGDAFGEGACVSPFNGDQCVEPFSGNSNLDPFGDGACISPFNASANTDAFTPTFGSANADYTSPDWTANIAGLNYSPADGRLGLDYSDPGVAQDQLIGTADTPEKDPAFMSFEGGISEGPFTPSEPVENQSLAQSYSPEKDPSYGSFEDETGSGVPASIREFVNQVFAQPAVDYSDVPVGVQSLVEQVFSQPAVDFSSSTPETDYIPRPERSAPPPVSGPDYSLYVPHGFVWQQYEAAYREAWNSDNPAWARLALGALAIAAAPLAGLEEYVGRSIANIPFVIENAGIGIGEHIGRAELWSQQGEYAEATVEGLQAVTNFSQGFVAAASVAAPAAGAIESTAIRESAGFTPSWAVTQESQAGWSSIRLAEASPQELRLVEDVVNADNVIIGRSINVQGRGMTLLDTWLENNGIKWSQRWQDVYNRSLFTRTSLGKPVNVMAGGGYTLGEVTAAEAGARSSGIVNTPYWPTE